MLAGPKGAGKTTLAERIPAILPDLTVERVARADRGPLAGRGARPRATGCCVRPPFLAPHHAASTASLLGGGTGRVRPGEVSRAHRGVLFLDEFPLFRADVIEALRQPLESGEVTIARGEESATLPGPRRWSCSPATRARAATSRADPRPTAAPARRCSAATTAASSPVRSPTGSTSSDGGATPGRTTGTTPPRPSRSRPPTSGRGSTEARRAPGRALRRPPLAAQRRTCPGPVLRERLAAEPTPAAALVDDRARTPARLTRRGATRVHRLAWTVADLRRRRPARARTRSTSRCGCASGDPLAGRARASAAS